ncbi:glycosyltransferase family 4 protein [Planctomicrobium sp. SH661]|uniref:glycosyltransferase family 4 protein n=1 Tax=Planctomicrobium sp. SH661 TaxID=3448124 RepID=UPI003F5B89FE
MHIAIITAGGAGMFCGSCMHDNTWARALIAQGVEVSLIPAYTPLRLDEQNISLDRIFLGGINVYLNNKVGWWKHLPRVLTSWLDRPGIIRMATSRSVSNDAAELGDLTISMLQESHGPHRAAIHELATFLGRDLKPDVVIFSNALLAGALSEIKRNCPVPVLCTLQGDDVFLDGLTPEYRQRAIELVSSHAREFDGFITHTEFYRDYISNYLSLPVEKFHVLPLGIDLQEHPGVPRSGDSGRYVVGYFARFAPEKGLHHLVEAFRVLKQRVPHAELRVGGYQGGQYADYAAKTLHQLDADGIPYQNIGSPDTIEGKVAFLNSLDVFSVPTDFLEPKGMPVLEAMANGIPVVQPAHGSFPEIIQKTGGGILVPPRDPQALARGLEELADPVRRQQLSQSAWQGVRDHYGSVPMARRTLEIIEQITG